MKPSRRIAVLSLVVLASVASLSAAEEKLPVPGSHVLFMGADLSVQRDKKIYRVEDVTGSELKIHVEGPCAPQGASMQLQSGGIER